MHCSVIGGILTIYVTDSIEMLRTIEIGFYVCICAITAAANFTTYILTKLYNFSYIYLNLYTGFYYFISLR